MSEATPPVKEQPTIVNPMIGNFHTNRHPSLPISHREYHPLNQVDLGVLASGALMADSEDVVYTPIGGQVQLGERVDPSYPFEIAGLVEVPVPRKNQVMSFSQIPLMVHHQPPFSVDEADPIKECGYGRLPYSDDVIDSFHNTEKNTEMVLAVNAYDFIHDVLCDQGTAEIPNFIEEGIYQDLSFVRRDWCENDKRFMQLLPYVVLYKLIDDQISIFVYQRGKGTGEQRLAGGCSIGLGGHINPHDFINVVPNLKTSDRMDDGFLSHSVNGTYQRVIAEGFWTGIWNNVSRELGEEAVFTKGGRQLALHDIIYPQMPEEMSIEEWLHSKTVFFSDYRAGDVEKTHLGMFMAIRLPDDVNVATNEEQLIDVGFIKLRDLAVDDTFNVLPTRLECWSKSIIESITRTIAFNEEVGPAVYTDGPTSNKKIANGEHAIEGADLARIPQGQRWAHGTLSQIFGRQYKYYAMNAIVRM